MTQTSAVATAPAAPANRALILVGGMTAMLLAMLSSTIVSTVSSFFIEQPKHFYGESSLWGKMAIFPIAIALYRQVPRIRELALGAILFFGAYLSAFGLWQYAAMAHRDLESRHTTGSSIFVTDQDNA